MAMKYDIHAANKFLPKFRKYIKKYAINMPYAEHIVKSKRKKWIDMTYDLYEAGIHQDEITAIRLVLYFFISKHPKYTHYRYFAEQCKKNKQQSVKTHIAEYTEKS